MKHSIIILFLFCLPALFGDLSASVGKETDQQDPLDQKIELKKTKGSVYDFLKLIGDQTGYLFVYDTQVVFNDRIVRVKKGSYTLRQAIQVVVGKEIQVRIEGVHLLLSKPDHLDQGTNRSWSSPTKPQQKIVEGRLIDRHTQEPIAYASVSIDSTSIGTITNQNGEFRLSLPDSLPAITQILFSHLGYSSQKIGLPLLTSQKNIISMVQIVMPIQEVVIRLVNPTLLLHEMLQNREVYYQHPPVYLTSFYREGIERNQHFVQLTEAVFQIYKEDYQSGRKDQVKMLKMRKISNESEKDTLIAKMKSGVSSCIILDLMKNLPDFLQEPLGSSYNYTNIDITEIDDRLVHVISFEQKEDIKEPLYKGNLSIDAENKTLLQASFEIHPLYIKKAAQMLVEKKKRNLTITPQKVTYLVSYKNSNGTYYISHIRGDLTFKVKKKRFLSFSSTLHTWFEIVTCKIDTISVNRFHRNEQLRTNTVFADTNFVYDNLFWDDFNVIQPEEKLNEIIRKISAKVEEISY